MTQGSYTSKNINKIRFISYTYIRFNQNRAENLIEALKLKQ